MRLPDFIIIGAMKCASTTLHEQLAAQPGIMMSDPKEILFFSDDAVYEKGIDWYARHFAAAAENSLCGESSTHYTKLPTYPHTVTRLKQHLPDVRFIYLMRHPIDRLVSQYIHQWTEQEITIGIDAALDEFEVLTAYSQYPRQLRPFFDAYGCDRVLPIFFDRLKKHPQAELERVCQFIGYTGTPIWQELQPGNVSSERMKKSLWRDAVVYAPVISQIRKYLIPQSIRDQMKTAWMMKSRPRLTEDNLARLETKFDGDLALLGKWIGVDDLNCANFKRRTIDTPYQWVPREIACSLERA